MGASTAYSHDPPVEIMPDVLFVHGRMRLAPAMQINRNLVAIRSGRALTPIIRTDSNVCAWCILGGAAGLVFHTRDRIVLMREAREIEAKRPSSASWTCYRRFFLPSM